MDVSTIFVKICPYALLVNRVQLSQKHFQCNKSIHGYKNTQWNTIIHRLAYMEPKTSALLNPANVETVFSDIVN